MALGTEVHEETSWKAFDSVFKFIEEQWKIRETDIQQGQNGGETIIEQPREDSEPLSKRFKTETPQHPKEAVPLLHEEDELSQDETEEETDHQTVSECNDRGKNGKNKTNYLIN